MRRYLEEENASRQPEDIPRPEAHKKTVRRYSPLGIAFKPCAPPQPCRNKHIAANQAPA